MKKRLGAISSDMADGVTRPIYILIFFHSMTGSMRSAVVMLQNPARRIQTMAFSSKLIPQQNTVPSTVHIHKVITGGFILRILYFFPGFQLKDLSTIRDNISLCENRFFSPPYLY